MKRLLPVLLLSLAATALADEGPDAAVHHALRQLKATMTKALNERDLDTIVANVTPDVVFTTMNGDVCRGPAQIRSYFEKMLDAPGHIVKNVRVSFEADALTTLYGGNTGVAYGSSDDHYELTTGQKFDVRGRWSCTMIRSGDRWLIASFHYSTNVFDNAIINQQRKLLLGAAVATGTIALIAGILLGVFVKRKSA